MTKIINFFGGPGCGKSTFSSELFYQMKNDGYNVELVTEFAKELTWNNSESLKDQIYVFGCQNHRLYTLINKVDYIICDSPILLSAIYMNVPDRCSKLDNIKEIKKSFINFVVDVFNGYDNINYMIERNPNKKFQQSGRNENYEKSKEIDILIDNFLYEYFIPSSIIKTIKEVNIGVL